MAWTMAWTLCHFKIIWIELLVPFIQRQFENSLMYGPYSMVLTLKVHDHRHIRVCKSAQHQDRFGFAWAS